MELFPFRFVDPLTGRWVRARYKATRQMLDERYPGGYEITGAPHVRGDEPLAPPSSPPVVLRKDAR